MTDLPPSLLIGASALVLHLVALTALVADFRDVPDRWWVRMWLGTGSPAPSRGALKRWIGGIFAVTFVAMATFLMVVFLFGGAHMTLIGAVELVIAVAWLWYLLIGPRAS